MHIFLPQKGVDGFYRPITEAEITALINKATQEGLGNRCCGAAHSLAKAIYTDPGFDAPWLSNGVYFQSQYSRWDDLMSLRELRGPKNISPNDYWLFHLFGCVKSEYPGRPKIKANSGAVGNNHLTE